MGAHVALRVVTAFLVLAAWSSVLWGLYALPVSPDPVLDLEAGPGFAVGIGVYVPSMGLTLLLLGLLAIGALTRWSWALATAAVVTASFGGWVLTHDELLAHRPGLEALLRWDFILSGTALALACICLATFPGSHRGASEPDLASTPA